MLLAKTDDNRPGFAATDFYQAHFIPPFFEIAVKTSLKGGQTRDRWGKTARVNC